MLELQLLLLIILANGSPILAQKLLGKRWQRAVDGGHCLQDGKPWFGPAKTWRGIVAACVVTPLAASALHFPFIIGVLIAVSAMLGDLLSSFIKRRLGLASSSMALALDQIPESFLPLFLIKLFAQSLLPPALQDTMSWAMVWQVVLMFFIVELLLSKILYYLHIRKQPY